MKTQTCQQKGTPKTPLSQLFMKGLSPLSVMLPLLDNQFSPDMPITSILSANIKIEDPVTAGHSWDISSTVEIWAVPWIPSRVNDHYDKIGSL